ncbi:MAG: ABC transporter ATP-binding protein [Candidatus Hodarchaeota archaeon]
MKILETKEISKMYGGVIAVQDVSFSLEKGEILGLIGPNGAGKTTLLDIVCRYSNIDKGEVWFESKVLNSLNPHEVARLGISRTFQIPRLFKNMTVIESLLTASNDLGLALDLLDSLDLKQLMFDSSKNLSGGQQKLLELARALIRKPKLLIADEPTAGLNPAMIEIALGMIRELNEKEKLSFLIVEHNMAVIENICNTCVFLDKGSKVIEGETQFVLNNPATVEAYLGR